MNMLVNTLLWVCGTSNPYATEISYTTCEREVRQTLCLNISNIMKLKIVHLHVLSPGVDSDSGVENSSE